MPRMSLENLTSSWTILGRWDRTCWTVFWMSISHSKPTSTIKTKQIK